VRWRDKGRSIAKQKEHYLCPRGEMEFDQQHAHSVLREVSVDGSAALWKLVA